MLTIKINKTIVMIALIAITSACHRSGTWDDDSQNWHRAFRSKKPADVVVVHSRYWRSPHFSYEFQYFFHIQRNDALRKQLFESNKLKKIEGDDRSRLFQEFFKEKPLWFLPKRADKYDVWIYEQRPHGNFRVFIDKENGDLFLTDYQV